MAWWLEMERVGDGGPAVTKRCDGEDKVFRGNDFLLLMICFKFLDFFVTAHPKTIAWFSFSKYLH